MKGVFKKQKISREGSGAVFEYRKACNFKSLRRY